MTQWYCNINGQSYGPVDEATLRQWIQEGRVTAQSLIYHESLGDWKPAGAVEAFASMFAAIPPPLPANVYGPGSTNTDDSIPPCYEGTGGQMSDDQVTACARMQLTNRWGMAIGACLVLALVNFALNLAPYVGGILSLIFGGALELGSAIFFLHFTRSDNAKVGMVFKGFNHFGPALGLYLLRGLFVLLWALLLIIPGIIAALAYSQAMYILAENPGIGATEAIRRSKEMMDGHKAKLFMVHLRMFVWGLLCLLTCGIGFIWLMPYMQTSLACFYNDLQAPPSPQSPT